MKNLDDEMRILKTDLTEMWNLVMAQLGKSRKSLENNDREIVHEVLTNEKKVDAFELKIDMECEYILARLNPVANDLRFVLAVLKINYNLERIGDYAKSIVKIVRDSEGIYNMDELIEAGIPQMFDITEKMLNCAREAFAEEKSKQTKSIFTADTDLDKINRNANHVISSQIVRNKAEIQVFLNMLSVIRKLERVGDQTKNIAEEIIFYLEAKILRHKKKSLK